ncbi:hypothetical protein [Streptomyces sp. NPDC094049]|uniref:hypothetical protein n=1 Tax=Streptomyces sp. NPDC094049 TaxID=3154987 RepID=UPI00331BC783
MGDALVLEQRGVQRRIPLAVVREIRVGAAGPHSVEVVLTGAEGAAGRAYRIDCRHGRSVAAFADAVNGALPAPGKAPHRDGAELVEVLPQPDRTGWAAIGRGTKTLLLVGIGVYAAGLTAMFLRGDLVHQLGWGLGFLPLLIGVTVATVVVRGLRDRVTLHRRGITATAVFQEKRRTKRFYAYVDADGTTHRVELPWDPVFADSAPQRVRVTYDPERPEFCVVALPRRTWVFRTVSFLVLGLPVLVLGLFLVPYQLFQVLFR